MFAGFSELRLFVMSYGSVLMLQCFISAAKINSQK